MDVVLKDEVRHAKKHYKCDAYAWWTNCNLDLNDYWMVWKTTMEQGITSNHQINASRSIAHALAG